MVGVTAPGMVLTRVQIGPPAAGTAAASAAPGVVVSSDRTEQQPVVIATDRTPQPAAGMAGCSKAGCSPGQRCYDVFCAHIWPTAPWRGEV